MIFPKKRYRLLTSLWLLTAFLFFATLTGCGDRIAPPDGENTGAEKPSYNFLYSVKSGTQWSYRSSSADGTLQKEFGVKLSSAPSGSGKSLMAAEDGTLYLIDLVTGNVLSSFETLGTFLEIWRFGYLSPAISPDGTRLAWTDIQVDGKLYTVLIDASGTNRVVLPVGAEFGSYMRFSPDGHYLAFFCYDYDAEEAGLYRVNADGTNLQQLLVETSPLRHDGTLAFDWSPDGSAIVFSQREINDEVSLYTVNSDGTELSLLTKEGMAPDWSPDGSKILYTQPLPSLQMAVINPDGTGKEILTPSAQGLLGRWSPDGKQILYAEYDQGVDPVCNPARIQVMDVASRSTTTVSSEGEMFGLYWVE